MIDIINLAAAYDLAKHSPHRITEEEYEDFQHACEYHQRMKQAEREAKRDPS